MNIPDEFSGRVLRLKSYGIFSRSDPIDKIIDQWPGSYIDVVYEKKLIEGSTPIINISHVIVFDTKEDAIAFKLKYGNKYV